MIFLPPKGKAVARELLRQRARPLAESPRHEISDNCAGNPDRVDAMMVVKARILARENGVDEIIGNLVKGNDDAVLSRQPAVKFPILVIDR